MRVARVTARTETPLPQSPEVSSAVDEEGDGHEDRDARLGMADVRQEPTPEPEGEREKGDARMCVDGDGRGEIASAEAKGERQGGMRMAQLGEDVQVDALEGAIEDESAPLYLSYPPIQREKVWRHHPPQV